MRQQFNKDRFAVYCDAAGFTPGIIDVHRELKRKNIETAKERMLVTPNFSPKDKVNEKLDITTWLPFAAKKYEISPDIKDYFFVPVITIPSDLPNRNGVAFPLASLIEFSVEYGMQAYKTFKGKPVHLEHKNDVPKEAYGVIVDSFLRKMDGYGGGKVWKLLELLAIDRTKYPEMAQRILSGEMNSYSMGAWVTSYSCSICNAAMGKCAHLHPKQPLDFYPIDDKLCFRNVHGIGGFETSIVGTPAYSVAASDRLMV